MAYDWKGGVYNFKLFLGTNQISGVSTQLKCCWMSWLWNQRLYNVENAL